MSKVEFGSQNKVSVLVRKFFWEDNYSTLTRTLQELGFFTHKLVEEPTDKDGLYHQIWLHFYQTPDSVSKLKLDLKDLHVLTSLFQINLHNKSNKSAKDLGIYGMGFTVSGVNKWGERFDSPFELVEPYLSSYVPANIPSEYNGELSVPLF